MANKTPSDDPGHMRCSDLDVPMFTSEQFALAVFFTTEHRKLLANDEISSETIHLLCDLCEQLLQAITNRTLKDVIPQVESMMHSKIVRGRNYFTVTEDDIQASIGDSFDTCFGMALGGEQKRSHHSETLMELFAEEVTKRVNQKLETITQSSSALQKTGSAELQTSNASHTRAMVYNINCILSKCLRGIYQLETPEDQESLDREFSKPYGLDQDSTRELKAEESEPTHSLPKNADVSHSENIESPLIPAEEDQETLDMASSEGSHPDVESKIPKEKCKNAQKTPSDDPGHMRCSDLDVPMFSSEQFALAVISFLNDITIEQRKLLANDEISSETIHLLCDLCEQLLQEITNRTLKDVIPQVKSMMHSKIVRGRNYFTVTEDDIQASIGDSFDTCFGIALGGEQKRSQHSETLMELFAEEVTKMVNQKLETITQSSSSPQKTGSAELQTSTASHTGAMGYNICRILCECLREIYLLESSKDQESLDREFSEAYGPDKESTREFKAVESEPTHSLPKNEDVSHSENIESPLIPADEDQETLDMGSSEGSHPVVESNKDLKAEESETSHSSRDNEDISYSENIESSLIPAVEVQETLDSEFSEGYSPVVESNGDLKAEESETIHSLPENADISHSENVESALIPAVEDQETLDSEFSEGYGPVVESNEDLKAEESETSHSSLDNEDISHSENIESSLIPAVEDQETLDSEFSEGNGPDVESNGDLEAEESETTHSLPENADISHSENVESALIPAVEDQETLDSEFSEAYGPAVESNKDLKAEESEATHSLQENEEISHSANVESPLFPAEEDQESLNSESSEGSHPDVECLDLKAEESETTHSLPDVSHSEIVKSSVIPAEEDQEESGLPDEEHNELKEEDADTICSSSESPDLETLQSSFSPSEEQEYHDWEFLEQFLCKLLDHIAISTNAPMFDGHFAEIVAYLGKCTMGRVTIPQTVGDIHIPIYKELCRQFGSASVLRDFMMSGDTAFDVAVGRTLRAQLQKPSGENISLKTKLKRFFCRTSRKVSPEAMIAPELMNTSPDMEPTHVSLRDKLKNIFCRKRRDVGQEPMDKVSYTSEEKKYHDWEFLEQFLCKLLDHIVISTNAPMFEVHFPEIVAHLGQCTMGRVTIPQTVGDIHIPIYKELCRQFGSASVLQDVLMSGDTAFDVAVGRTLRAQLQKPSGENISLKTKLKRFFCRTSRKVSPEVMIAPEPQNTSPDMEPTHVSLRDKLKKIFCRKRRDVGQEPMDKVSYTEVIELVNGMTPTPEMTPKRPTIHGKMSSMAKVLRKPFTCCICGAQDD